MKKLVAIVLVCGLMLCIGGCSKKEFSRGVITRDTYKNDFGGITFTLGDDWTFATDEEIADMLSLGIEAMDMDNFEKTAAENSTVYDMVARNTTTGATVIVGYENLEYSNAAAFSEEDYLANIERKTGQTGIVTFTEGLGNEYYSCSLVKSAQGEYEQRTFVKKINDYMLVILVTTTDYEEFAQVSKMFE